MDAKHTACRSSNTGYISDAREVVTVNFKLGHYPGLGQVYRWCWWCVGWF
jgi:hypothetical protein